MFVHGIDFIPNCCFCSPNFYFPPPVLYCAIDRITIDNERERSLKVGLASVRLSSVLSFHGKSFVMPGHNLSHMYVLIVKVASCFVPSRPIDWSARWPSGTAKWRHESKANGLQRPRWFAHINRHGGVEVNGGRHSHYSQKLYYFWGSKLNSIAVTWGNLQPIRLGNMGIRM